MVYEYGYKHGYEKRKDHKTESQHIGAYKYTDIQDNIFKEFVSLGKDISLATLRSCGTGF